LRAAERPPFLPSNLNLTKGTKMQVKIKKVHEDAVIPSKAHASDAGFDLVATSFAKTDEYLEYGTGIAIEVPEGHVGLLYPRSSISKKDLTLCNSVGIIDVGFVGELKFRFKLAGKYEYYVGWTGGDKLYEVGDRIGQLIIMPIPAISFLEVDDLGSSERGEGSFGSSGS